jgi:hypothetical protein
MTKNINAFIDYLFLEKKYSKHTVNAYRKDIKDFTLFLKEEFDETFKATDEKNAEEIVDGLIDLCVVAIGTLDAFGVDPYKAWDAVYKANMAKVVGVKPSRPNPLGLPDLIKPEDWSAPDHTGNHCILPTAYFCSNMSQIITNNHKQSQITIDIHKELWYNCSIN